MPPPSSSGAQGQLSGILVQAEDWARGLSELSGIPEISESGQKCAVELQRLRTHAMSTLIKIAVVGSFSSGKSTLVSALAGKLEVSQVTDVDGNLAERVIGILPIAPGPASACPARVVPVSGGTKVDASGRGFLRVRFVDSPDWEDIAANPDPKLLAAYAASSADRGRRKEEHRQREVAEAEILLSDCEIPAMIYDLPGYGAAEDPYRNSIVDAIYDADCFIYVTRASRPLAKDDLEIINFLQKTRWRKRVIWVLTGIDDAIQVDADFIPGWHSILREDNDYLAEYFGDSDGGSGVAFIGEGFRGVSPIAEARAKGGGEIGGVAEAGRPVPGRPALCMEDLRQVIREMIEAESGRKHVAEVAREALGTIRPLEEMVSKRWHEERGDWGEILARDRELLERVDAALAAAPSDLGRILDSRVRRASRLFAELVSHLHDRLEAEIREADLSDERKANRFAAAGTQILRSWAEAPGGPIELEDRQVEEYQKELTEWAWAQIGSADASIFPDGAQFDIRLLDFTITKDRTGPWSDLLKNIAALIGVTTGVTGLATYVAGLAGVVSVFPPAAAVAGVAGLMYLGIAIFGPTRNAVPADKMKNDLISQLNKNMKTLQGQFKDSLGVRGGLMIKSVEKYLEERKSQLDTSIQRIDARIGQPEYRRSRDLAQSLELVKQTGEQLIDDLDGLRERCS